jgi:hypothetical protein
LVKDRNLDYQLDNAIVIFGLFGRLGLRLNLLGRSIDVELKDLVV